MRKKKWNIVAYRKSGRRNFTDCVVASFDTKGEAKVFCEKNYGKSVSFTGNQYEKGEYYYVILEF